MTPDQGGGKRRVCMGNKIALGDPPAHLIACAYTRALTRLEAGVTVPRDQQREIVRLLYVATRHQAKARAAVLELDGLE